VADGDSYTGRYVRLGHHCYRIGSSQGEAAYLQVHVAGGLERVRVRRCRAEACAAYYIRQVKYLIGDSKYAEIWFWGLMGYDEVVRQEGVMRPGPISIRVVSTSPPGLK
jgi:hypothetical protein